MPFAAGTFTDIVPRIVLEQVSTQIGQAIVIENRPGAGSTTGAAAVAKAAPDGYTLLVNSSAQTIAPALYPGLSYDPSRDFYIAITALANTPSVLVVSANEPIQGYWRPCKGREGAARFPEFCVRRCRHRNAFERDPISVERRDRSDPRAIQGRARSHQEIIAGRIDFFLRRSPTLCRWCGTAS